MAALDTTATISTTSFFGGVYKLIGKLNAWNDTRLTRKTLSALSDRELADIGLARGDIEKITA